MHIGSTSHQLSRKRGEVVFQTPVAATASIFELEILRTEVKKLTIN